MKLFQHAVALALAGLATPAFAYIDPGSGSAIMSAIVGFFVALAMIVKTYWYKLKSIFSGKTDAGEPGQGTPENKEEE